MSKWLVIGLVIILAFLAISTASKQSTGLTQIELNEKISEMTQACQDIKIPDCPKCEATCNSWCEKPSNFQSDNLDSQLLYADSIQIPSRTFSVCNIFRNNQKVN